MVSLGIGLTSNCNLSCAHCYRDQDRIYNLTLADIQKAKKDLGYAPDTDIREGLAEEWTWIKKLYSNEG